MAIDWLFNKVWKTVPAVLLYQFRVLSRIINLLLQILSFHSPFTVPASPENVMLTTTSSPLRVTWTIDPPDGLVSNYTIYVTRLERGNTVVNYTSTNTQFDILNLDPYELVEVSVSASNSAGEGPSSPGVRGRTREERKLRNASHLLPRSIDHRCIHIHIYTCMYIKPDLHVQLQVLWTTAHQDGVIWLVPSRLPGLLQRGPMGCSSGIISSLQPMMGEESLLLRVLGVVL